jgi:hypothetical protein
MRATPGVLIGLASLAAAALVIAGPLDPPAGPVGPTYKTLTEVEPRTPISAATTPGGADHLFHISQPGSYYLTSNIVGVTGKSAIQVSASGVTIDLNGFELKGANGALDGVRVLNSGVRGLEIRNGTVREWPEQGIDASAAWSCALHDLRIVRNFAGGAVTGNEALVENCLAEGNATVGIEVFGDSRVTGCIAIGNAVGIKASFGTLIEGNTVNSSGNDGILAFASNRITGNVCSGNGNGVSDGAGIHATGAGNHIEGNTVIAADRGYDVDAAGNFIARNTARSCTTAYATTGTQTIGPIITATGTITTSNPWANFAY